VAASGNIDLMQATECVAKCVSFIAIEMLEVQHYPIHIFGITRKVM
jgi:hypothetical protein